VSAINHRVGGVLGLLACLALAVLITVVVPNPSTDVRRRYDDVAVGAYGSTPTVRARVTRVEVTDSTVREYDDSWVSDQALVVVSVEAQVRQRVVQFSRVMLRTSGGQEYKPRDEFISAALGETQPGFTRQATLVFELPPSRVPGAALVLDADAASIDAYADAIRVDLGLRAPVTISRGPVAVPSTTVQVT
jgi:hypothetical protein